MEEEGTNEERDRQEASMSSRLVKIWIKISVGRVSRECFGGHGGGSGDWLEPCWRVRRVLRCPKDIRRRSSIISEGSREEEDERRR